MNILIAAQHWAVSSGRYMADAFQRSGHHVCSIGPGMGTRLWDITVPHEYVWTPNPPPKKWRPDLVILMDGNWVWDPPEKRWGDCPHIVYGVDNHVRRYDHCIVDHLFLAHSWAMRMDEENVTWLPCAYDSQWFAGGPPWAERKVDAAMMAFLYPRRAELLYAIRERLPDITINYGRAVYPEYAAAYRNAKISLIASYSGDLAQRVFETAAMGCLLLMDETPDNDKLGLKDGENCLVYQTKHGKLDYDHIQECIEWVLAHPDKAARIAAAGQKWATPHTWDARADVILQWVSDGN